MAQAEQILTPENGIDQDASVVTPPAGNAGVSPFEKGWFRYAKNLRTGSSSRSNVGAGENIPSTLENSTYYTWNGTAFVSSIAPAGNFTCIGRKEDPSNGRFYYCVHNDAGNHVILMFVKAEAKIYELLLWTGLNFDTEHLVSMALINNFVILTDDYNPPRVLDRTAIYNLKFTLTTEFSEFHISFVKWPPIQPPIVTDGGRLTIVGTPIPRYVQFIYRYTYVGGFKSTWSPPSNFVKSLDRSGPTECIVFLVSTPGFMFDYNVPADTSFDGSDIKFTSIVDSVEYAYRESAIDSWKLFAKQDNPSLSAVWNTPANTVSQPTGPIAIISQSEVGQYFDVVPLLSGAVESIDNRPMFADNEDDFDIPEFHVTNVEVYSAQNFAWMGPTASFTDPSINKPLLATFLTVQNYSFKEGGIYKAGIVYQHYSGRTSLVITNDSWVYTIPRVVAATAFAEYWHALGFKIPVDVNPPDWAIGYQIVLTDCLNIDFYGYGYANDFKFLLNVDSGIQTDIASPPELQTILNDYFNKPNTPSDLTLSNRIISYTRKNSSAATVPNCSRIFIQITNWYLTTKSNAGGTSNNPPNNLFYNYQPGDRVRFYASTKSGATWATSDLQIYDEPIIEFTGQGIIVNKPSGVLKVASRANNYGTYLEVAYRIEIYRPKVFSNAQGSEVLFYEKGEWYPITQPTTASRDFLKRDFTFTSAAAVTQINFNGEGYYNKMPISNGDVHMNIKSFYYDFFDLTQSGVNGGVLVSQMSPDKFNPFGVWDHNDGRAYVAYKSSTLITSKPSQIRFGGKYFQDGIFNAINNFRDENQFTYPAEYGRIRSLVNTGNAQVESVGNILLAIGEEQPWSIYVNRVTIDDLSGRTQVGLSDKVLGSYNTLLGDFGTLNPESVSKNNGKVIWWDAKKGTWVRYSRDGITPISQIYNMKNWFKDLAELLINYYGTDENPKVISVQDNYHDTWITFLNHSTLPETFKGYDSYKCVEFSEDQDQWKTIFDYGPDALARLDNDVYSIIGTVIHIHEAGDDFNSFYGVKKNTEVEFVCNPLPRFNKIWDYLNIQSSDKWSFTSIKGDFRSNGAIEQETEILLSQIDEREFTFVVDMKRDENTVNVTNPVVEGKVMRSRSLRLYMRLDEAVDYLSIFYYLIVGYQDSPKNPKK